MPQPAYRSQPHPRSHARSHIFRLLPFALVLLLAPLAAGCSMIELVDNRVSGSGTLVEQTREVDDFQGVAVASGLRAEVSIGDETSVTVELDDNLLDEVETVVEDGVLHIRPVSGSFGVIPSNEVQARVTVPELRSATASGGARLSASGVASEDLSAAASGGARIQLEGRADHLEANASGGARVEATALEADEVEAAASGGARVEVSAAQELDANASGGARICYVGDPTVDMNVSGGARVDAC